MYQKKKKPEQGKQTKTKKNRKTHKYNDRETQKLTYKPTKQSNGNVCKWHTRKYRELINPLLKHLKDTNESKRREKRQGR